MKNDKQINETVANLPRRAPTVVPKPGAALPDAEVIRELAARPVFDAVLRQQAVKWVAGGFIGKSIRDSSRAGGYIKATHFRVPNPLPKTEFRYWHVDNLLESAAVLVDRFLATQAEWREKLARSFLVETEIMQYLENEKIYASEIASGLYTTPYVEAFQVAEGEKTGLKFTDKATEFANTLYTTWYGAAERNQQGFNSQIAGHVSGFPTYKSQQAEPKLDFEFKYPNQMIKKDTKPGWLKETAFSQIRFQMSVGEVSTGLDLMRQRSTAESARVRITGLSRRADWERDNQGYRRQRTDVVRKAAEAKVGAFTMPDGALNYREQMRPLADRMTRDAIDSLARLDAAEEGLRLIYGRTSPLPASVRTAIDTGAVTHAAMDDASRWTRDALSWLLQFKQLEQNFVMPLSVRSLCGSDEKWFAGLASGSWSITVPPGLFSELAHVRVRGARAHVYGCGQDAGYWTLTAKLPKQGTVRHLAGAARPLDQKKLPVVIFPRTGSRINAPEAEFVGMHALFNASPIGDWTLTISEISTQRQARSVISDVEIEVALAVRAVPI
jgi:hypothetical protein